TSNIILRITTGSGDVVLKSYKFLDTGNREPEILARLHGRKFPHVARLLGDVALGRGKDRLELGIATNHVDAVDLFTWLCDGWRESLCQEVVPRSDGSAEGLNRASELGVGPAARVASAHRGSSARSRGKRGGTEKRRSLRSPFGPSAPTTFGRRALFCRLRGRAGPDFGGTGKEAASAPRRREPRPILRLRTAPCNPRFRSQALKSWVGSGPDL